jgi:hypothetical protein
MYSLPIGEKMWEWGENVGRGSLTLEGPTLTPKGPNVRMADKPVLVSVIELTLFLDF